MRDSVALEMPVASLTSCRVIRRFSLKDFSSIADYVVTDAAEGYNPTHDLCRTITGVAVELAGRAGARPLPLYEYVVAGDRAPCLDRKSVVVGNNLY